MYSSFAALAFVCAMFASAHGYAVRVDSKPMAAQVTSVNLFHRAIGLSAHPRDVGGIVPCGAIGEIVDVTFTGCSNVPCQTNVGSAYDVGVVFKPSTSHSALRLEIIVLHNGQNNPIIDQEVPDSGVVGGTQYTLGYTIRMTDFFLGSATLAFRLFGGDIQEVCFIVGLQVTQP